MANPFLAEIRIFGFNFAPKGWAFCAGQILPLSQNTALFSLLGTTYGGDGKSTFALPNLEGSAPMHPGQGPGLSLHDLGETGGSTSVTLLQSEMPSHNHTFQGNTTTATNASPANAVYMRGHYNDGVGNTGAVDLYTTNAPDTTLNPFVLGIAGGNQPHNNMQPYLTLNFCIALQGVYPPRT
jgi:microcystin-dependent protein